MTTLVLDVPGISCGHCKAAIEGEVAKVPGVDSVTVDVDARNVTVVGHASAQAITEAIVEAGYDVADS